MGVIAQDESKAMQSAPAWSQYENNEEYWKLMEALEKCAKETGIFKFVNSSYLFSLKYAQFQNLNDVQYAYKLVLNRY